MSTAPTRPVMRYHGGKWKLAPWVIDFMPPHQIYVEPFGGAASVLMRKPRSYGEVYNDLEGEIVNVFRVLRNKDTATELKRLIELTPFARQEFHDSYEKGGDEVCRAHKMIIRAYMGFGSAAMTRTHRTGFRSNSNRSGTTPAHDWASWPDQIEAFTERLKGVVIENRHAVDVIKQHDGLETLHYVDPPYVWDTRSGSCTGKRQGYKHELDDAQHIALAEVLRGLKGMVILSGYPCDLYDKQLYSDWHRFERKHFADGARERMEVVWLNPAAYRRYMAETPSLFEDNNQRSGGNNA